MKTILLSLALFTVVCFSTSAFAADKKSTMNIRFNPVALLVSGISAEFDYKISERATLGPEYARFNFAATTRDTSTSLEASEIGAQGRYFSDRFGESSWYTAAGMGYSTAEASVTSSGAKYTGSASSVYFKVGGGYHWFWESFNMSLGAGLTLTPSVSLKVKDSKGNEYKDSIKGVSTFSIAYTLGWMF